MTCCTVIILDHETRARDVTKVLGALLGLDRQMTQGRVKIPAISLKSSSVSGMATIEWDRFYVSYHYEGEGGRALDMPWSIFLAGESYITTATPSQSHTCQAGSGRPISTCISRISAL
jgi:hypothetical protein